MTLLIGDISGQLWKVVSRVNLKFNPHQHRQEEEQAPKLRNAIASHLKLSITDSLTHWLIDWQGYGI